MKRLTRVLVAVAVGMWVLVGVVAVLPDRGPSTGGEERVAPEPEAAPEPTPEPTTERTPEPRWSRLAASEVVHYRDGAGRPIAGIRAPAVLDEGYCAEAAGAPSGRAYAGWTRPATGGLAAEDVASRLAEEFARGVRPADGLKPTPTARTRPVVLDDGTAAQLASLAVSPGPGPCRAAQVAVDVVSLEPSGGATVHSWALVRDVPAPDAANQGSGLSQATAQAMLRACATARSAPSGRDPCAAPGWPANG